MGMSAISRPRPTTMTCSAVSAISLIRWEDTKTVRPSAARRLQQVTDPADPLRVQAVDRLVEDEGRRVGQQRRRDAEPLSHAQGEAAGPLAGDLVQPDHVDHLVDPAHPRCRGSRPGPAGGCTPSARCAPHAPPAARRPPAAASDAPRRARPSTVTEPDGRRVETEDHPHRRGLAGAVRPEEPGHDARPDGEGQVVRRRPCRRTAW